MPEAAIYTGDIAHHREKPRLHSFNYKVFMMYVDVENLTAVTSHSFWWSNRKRFWPATFRREDFHGDPELSIREAVCQTIEKVAGVRPSGSIFMLANWRYWGVNFNPLTTYYCFDADRENPSFILAEVTNTPWNERRAYVLAVDSALNIQETTFAKTMHVSPFNPMAMTYDWKSITPAHDLQIKLANYIEGERVFSAHLLLQRRAITSSNLLRVLIEFPLMTVKVIVAIHWQAFRLWLKRLPVYDHSKASADD